MILRLAHEVIVHKADYRVKLFDAEGLSVELFIKALCTLLQQVYLRDSRRKFCPDGHWQLGAE